MANSSLVVAQKRNQIYWKGHTNIYLCLLVIMYTWHFLQLLWLYFFFLWKFENFGWNHIGLVFRQITQPPFGCSCSILPPLPSSLTSKFMDKMLFKALLYQGWKQPGDSTQQQSLSGCISLWIFWSREKKRMREGKGEASWAAAKNSVPYWMGENVISIFSYCQRQH